MQTGASDNQSESQQNDQETQSSVKIDLTPEFQKNLRNLAKRYRSISSDVQSVIQDLESGNFSYPRLQVVNLS